MSALLKFECRVPVGGYRIVTFDERKFFDLQLDPASDDDSILPPANLTEDEQSLLNKWGMRVVPWGDPEVFEHELQEVFEPNSERIRCFDLFDETSTPYLDFANALKTVDGAKALADRFGPLHEGPQFYERWYWVIMEMHSAVAAWDKAKATGNFSRLIQKVGRQARRSIEKHPETVIDASIVLRKDPLSGKARLCIRPSTLLDALWTQLALAIDGSESLRTCVECKKWFTIKADRGRSDKEYCSDACRMRAYRKRKEER
jgi:hypothetical protein